MSERGDEAEPATGLTPLHIASRPTRAGKVVLEREAILKPRPHQTERQILLGAVAAGLAHRHGLDQGEVEAPPMCPAEKRLDLVLVHASERYRVDLDLDPGAVGGIDAGHDGREISSAGDRPEPVGLEGVERDIDAGDAASGKGLGMASKLAAVGGEG